MNSVSLSAVSQDEAVLIFETCGQNRPETGQQTKLYWAEKKHGFIF
jgi:hypothetical protein